MRFMLSTAIKQSEYFVAVYVNLQKLLEFYLEHTSKICD